MEPESKEEATRNQKEDEENDGSSPAGRDQEGKEGSSDGADLMTGLQQLSLRDDKKESEQDTDVISNQDSNPLSDERYRSCSLTEPVIRGKKWEESGSILSPHYSLHSHPTPSRSVTASTLREEKGIESDERDQVCSLHSEPISLLLPSKDTFEGGREEEKRNIGPKQDLNPDSESFYATSSDTNLNDAELEQEEKLGMIRTVSIKVHMECNMIE